MYIEFCAGGAVDSIMFVEMNLYVGLLDVHRVLCRRSGGQHHVQMNLYVELLDVHRVLCRRSGGQHHVC